MTYPHTSVWKASYLKPLLPPTLRILSTLEHTHISSRWSTFFFFPNVNRFISYYKSNTHSMLKKKRIYKSVKQIIHNLPTQRSSKHFVFSPSRLEVYIYYQLLLFQIWDIFSNHTCCSPTLLPHLMMNIILIIKLTCNPKIKVTEQSSTGTVPDTVRPWN